MTDILPQDDGERSLWAETAIVRPVGEVLQDSIRTDVLVVGAGYTGLSSALHLAEHGVSATVIDANAIGFGGSGRNAGLVNAGVWQSPQHVIKQLGQEKGDRFNQALRDSPKLVFDLIRRFDMRCQAQQCGTVNIAHNSQGMRYLTERHRQLQAVGSAVELIDGNRAIALSGSSGYRYGGILDPHAGTIQPLSYVRSLAQAAQARGAQIYEQTPLRELVRVDDRWLATTPQGEVSAEQVILATNAYSTGESQQVDKSILPFFIFHCATDPLPVEIAAQIIPERQGLWDTRRLMLSLRIDSAGRLVMSSPGRLGVMQRRLRMNWMTRVRNQLYPLTRRIPWSYYWSGQVGMTSTKILRVQLLAPGLFAPAGYNGRGIGPGTVIGKCLAETIISGNRNDFPFPIEALYREKWRLARSAYYNYATLALQSVDKRWTRSDE